MTVYSLQNKRKEIDKQTKQNADIGKEIKKTNKSYSDCCYQKNLY